MVTEEELSKMSPEEISELQKQNCIFCKIIKEEVLSKKVYEDEQISAVLDIRPATEGHLLVMPKEHFPILPLIPKEISKHMFEKTKDLCSSVRTGVPSLGTTVFIANGAAAGQQSPHFLFHIIPRTENDGFFKVPELDLNQDDVKEGLTKRFGILVKNYLAHEGKLPPEEAQEAAKEQLSMFLEKNPQIKQMLIEKPDEFKAAIEQNPQLQEFFKGVDIDRLSESLKELEGNETPIEQEETKEPEEEHEEDNDQEEQVEENEQEQNEGSEETDDENSDDEDDGISLDEIARLFK